jgi:hypothetical protein
MKSSILSIFVGCMVLAFAVLLSIGSMALIFGVVLGFVLCVLLLLLLLLWLFDKREESSTTSTPIEYDFSQKQQTSQISEPNKTEATFPDVGFASLVLLKLESERFVHC